MMRSLFSGVSGLKTHQQKMDVIGNNIANVNTTAFKSTSTTFQDVMYQTMSNASGGSATRGGVNARQIGLGVSTAANKVSITTQGSSEATGDGLDLRLVDKQSTNFFIVSDGTQNLFTRSGSFYVDGNGNLAMTSTGYLVQGWQVNSEGSIQRDTVSPLKVMSAEHQTSNPEYTTQAHVTGLIDPDDANVNSTSGHVMNLTFYDNIGNTYTARFSMKKGEDSPLNAASSKDITDNGYTIELESITSDTQTDSTGKPIDLLEQYINRKMEAAGNTFTGSDFEYTNESGTTVTTTDPAKARQILKSKIFGDPDGYNIDSFKIDANSGYSFGVATSAMISSYSLSVSEGASVIIKGTGNDMQVISAEEVRAAMERETTSSGTQGSGNTVLGGPNAEITFRKSDGSNGTTVEASKIFSGLSAAARNYYQQDDNGNATDNIVSGLGVTIDANTGTVKMRTNATNYDVLFKVTDGTLDSVSGRNTAETDGTRGFGTGGTTALFHPEVLGDQFSQDGITIDFSSLLNYNNGGKSTAGIDRGTYADSSDGSGKMIGTMTGLTIQNDGQIYASYSNGNTELLGQIPVARFANASGLESLGNNCYQTTLNSGSFDGIGEDITSDGSSMNSGYLEMSNVDLAQEFTQMITTQRGFQANSRIITVSDTMLEELTNLKR